MSTNLGARTLSHTRAIFPPVFDAVFSRTRTHVFFLLFFSTFTTRARFAKQIPVPTIVVKPHGIFAASSASNINNI